MPKSRSYRPRSAYRQSPALKTADLRYPISLLKSSQVASPTDETWRIKVKPYASLFAAFDEGITRPSQGDEADEETLHVFVIRYDPALVVECGDFVVFEDVLYVISELQKKRGRVEFMELRTKVYSKVATSGIETDNTLEVPVAPVERNNPFFTD